MGFLRDLEKIEKTLDRTAKDFSETKKKLNGGRGDIISRIEKIKTLGLKPPNRLMKNIWKNSILILCYHTFIWLQRNPTIK